MEDKTNSKIKTAAWIRLIVSLIAVLFLIAILVLGILAKDGGFPFFSFGGGYYSSADKYSVGNGEITAEPGSLREIDIDWIDGSIEVVGSATASAISIQETSSQKLDSENQVHYYYHNNTLNIQYRESGWLFWHSRSMNKHLVVTVPLNLCDTDSLNLQTDSVSSDVSIKNMDLEYLETDSVSGKVTFEGRVKKIECDTVSGECQLRSYISPSSVECDSVSANVTLIIPAESEFRAEHDAVSGKFYADDFSCEKTDDDTYRCGSGSDHYEFDSVSGDVTISAIR